eukprot:2116771-Amphidinium_carterae.1
MDGCCDPRATAIMVWHISRMYGVVRTHWAAKAWYLPPRTPAASRPRRRMRALPSPGISEGQYLPLRQGPPGPRSRLGPMGDSHSFKTECAHVDHGGEVRSTSMMM